jgi:hypothetical protein
MPPNANPNMATAVMIKGTGMALLRFFKFPNLLLAYYLTDRVIWEQYEKL